MRKSLIVLIALLTGLAATTAKAQTKAFAAEGDTIRYSGRLYVDSNNSLLLTLMIVSQNDSMWAWLGSPDQTNQMFPVTKSYITKDSISVSIKDLSAKLRGVFVEDPQSHYKPLADAGQQRDNLANSIQGRFFQGMNIRSITLHRYNGTSPYYRPQTPKPPFPYEVKEVQFANPQTPYLFHGTLTYPGSAAPHNYNVRHETPEAPYNYRYPAVILVSGSGAQDRDEAIFGHRPFAVIADQLSRNGIVVLRYDDRGWGSSDTNLYAGTTADFAEDARCALQYLRSMPMVDTNCVGIIGHSEGGNIAEMLAADGSVDFAIFMAAPGVSGKEILESQTRYILQHQGATKEQLDKAVEGITQMAQKTSGMNNRWMNYFYHSDPTPYLRKIKKNKVPVLVLQGGKDCQVLPEPNIRAMKRNLRRKTATIAVYADRNHLFQPCVTGLPNEYATIEETIDPQVVKDMQAFILYRSTIEKLNK